MTKCVQMQLVYWIVFFVQLFTIEAFAGEADVVAMKVRHNGGNSFQIVTTVKHGDTGWNHYTNGWEVLDDQGNVLGKRVLHHPHVNEQPFSRSLTLDLLPSVESITVRALDSVHGTGGKTLRFQLQR
jgi:hypothetical protein